MVMHGGFVSTPMVIASFAQTADGQIATAAGASRSISGSETLTLAHRLRDYADGILVGIGTVLRDDPELSCRIPGGSSPERVILDAGLRMPLDSRIVTTSRSIPTTLVTALDAPEERADHATALERAGLRLKTLPVESGYISIPALLRELGGAGMRSLFVEGGSHVLTSFLAARAIDRILLVTAPLLMGRGIPAFAGPTGPEGSVPAMPERLRLKRRGRLQLGRDMVWEVAVEYS